MLKYLIIQLDESSTSFCHYTNDRTLWNLIPIDILKKGIFWSMKENLTLQFIYPDYEIPEEYKSEIDKTFHADIVSSTCEDTKLRESADVVVFDSFAGINFYKFKEGQSYVFRTTLHELFDNSGTLYSILSMVDTINILIMDIWNLTKEIEKKYKQFLESLSNKVVDEYENDHAIQINLLTDRILLDAVNNCKAGDESISLCPDGKFYVCPAFYSDRRISNSIGTPEDGLKIKNPQLYKISHAPICRICDAYQCRRCVWLNKNMTLEINTPSHEQCVIAHIERNASRDLLKILQSTGLFMPGKRIKDLNYLDPFDKLMKNI